MSGETTQANFTVQASYVVANMVPYFRTNIVMLNNIAYENFVEKTGGMPGSTVLKFGTQGNVTVSVTSEAASVTKSQYDESDTSLTVQKASAYVELTNEAELFGNSMANLDRLSEDAGKACAQKFDVDALALADGFSSSVGTTGVALTASTLKKAPYKIRLNKVSDKLIYVLHPTQIENLQDNIITTSAPVWSSQNVNLDLLNGQPPQSNGRVGSFLGVDVFESTNTKSINAAADWAGLCFSPRFAIAAGLLGRFVAMVTVNAQLVLTGMSLSMYYQVAEWSDGAGCLITSKQ